LLGTQAWQHGQSAAFSCHGWLLPGPPWSFGCATRWRASLRRSGPSGQLSDRQRVLSRRFTAFDHLGLEEFHGIDGLRVQWDEYLAALLAAPEEGITVRSALMRNRVVEVQSGATWCYSQGEAKPLGAQPLPRVRELAASNAADPTAFGRVGATAACHRATPTSSRRRWSTSIVCCHTLRARPLDRPTPGRAATHMSVTCT
jgi:hypothetical protein